MAEADTGHWKLIDGRRWRMTDPGIPEKFRSELVAELMSARRAVGTAQRTTDPDGEAQARQRVQHAKVALGERGAPWWTTPSAADRRRRIEATTLALAGHRAPDRTICPSDVARTLGGEHWRALMDPVRAAVADLVGRAEIDVMQRGRVVPPEDGWRGPLRIRLRDPRPLASPDAT